MRQLKESATVAALGTSNNNRNHGARMERRYVIWDVFTARPLAGNPLAIVLDTDGLSGESMQAIAREFSLSETVFVLPPRLPAHTARIRIFTPQAELPFAGHPTIGAAIQLANERISGAAADCDALITLEENIGSIRIGVTGRNGAAPYAEFDVPKLPSDAGAPAHDDRLAAALGLAPFEIGFENYRPSMFEAGNLSIFVPVKDMEAVARAQIVSNHWQEAFSGLRCAVMVFCRETIRHDANFHARVFAPAYGIAEDPATGSAAAAFAGVVHRFDQPPEGISSIIIEQGMEMGRPSEIKVEMEVEARKLRLVRIGGSACRVMSGRLHV
jgi:trans-2,3-dihydro-3-hydroxyanthranilate isomerase